MNWITLLIIIVKKIGMFFCKELNCTKLNQTENTLSTVYHICFLCAMVKSWWMWGRRREGPSERASGWLTDWLTYPAIFLLGKYSPTQRIETTAEALKLSRLNFPAPPHPPRPQNHNLASSSSSHHHFLQTFVTIETPLQIKTTALSLCLSPLKNLQSCPPPWRDKLAW